MYLKTTSLIKYLQCVGRGGRTLPGKDFFIHLDFGENITYHGLWSEPRQWSLKPPKKKKEAAAPMKDCPQCSAMLYASVRKCNFCGFDFPIDDSTGLLQGVAVEVNDVPFKGRKLSDLSVPELYELNKSSKYKASYIWRIVRNKGEHAINEFGALAGFKHGWITRQMEQLSDADFFDKTIA